MKTSPRPTNDAPVTLEHVAKIAEATQQIGTDTLTVLHAQGDQIDRIERKTEDVNRAIDRAADSRAKIEHSWWPRCFRRQPKVVPAPAPHMKPHEVQAKSDDALDRLVAATKNLRGLAEAMGDELDRHDHALDRIDLAVDEAIDAAKRETDAVTDIRLGLCFWVGVFLGGRGNRPPS